MKISGEKLMGNNLETILSFVKKYIAAILISAFFMIFLGIAGLVFFDRIVMPGYARTGEEYPVPDITGYGIVQARGILSSEGFVISDEINRVVNYDIPSDQVLDQYPKPGAKCKKGRVIFVTVSTGALPVTVPDLIGLSPQDAKYRISDSKLVLDSILYEFSTDFPEGVVMGQSLVVSDSVDIGDTLYIVVSVGKHPSEFVVPNVTEQPLEKAAETINKSGFKISEVVRVFNLDYLPDTVLDQKPAAGDIVYKGAEIRLLVSSMNEQAKKDSLE
jgi:eukaryotic-like serine/threonine-protein kinase